MGRYDDRRGKVPYKNEHGYIEWLTPSEIAAIERIDAAHAASQAFGSGDTGGDRNWSAPVHGSTADGRDVTASFGQGSRDGETLISDGHVGLGQFYGSRGDGKGHDHYGPNGEPYGDRGRTS